MSIVIRARSRTECCVFLVRATSGFVRRHLIVDDLRGDCTRCAALCCVALAIDRSASFAFDKAAGEPCANLRGHLCVIHDELETRGCSGGARYDCAGAGQRVVHEVFAGRDEDPPQMIDAFRVMRDVQELRVLLRALDAWLARPLSKDDLTALDASGFFARARAAFQSLGSAENASGASSPMNGSFGGIKKRCS
jgi:hypothetical protein